MMRKFFANIICAFVPQKRLRKEIRGILSEFGIGNYFKTIRAESRQTFKHYLSVCAIAKNEGRYFREWIEYHKTVGVEKFYIYDNESSDDTKEVLAPYISSGTVDYVFWPGENQQIPAYEDCVAHRKYDTRWLALIDLDEFIVPSCKDGAYSSIEHIPQFLQSLPVHVSQLSVGALFYGSSGHRTKPDGLVMENYTYRAPRDSGLYFAKAILKPAHIIKARTHISEVIRRTVDENGNDYCDSYGWAALTHDRIRINHYYCKSFEEYCRKRARGDARYGKIVENRADTEAHFQRYDVNDIFDPIMDAYIARVKAAVKMC